MLVGMSQQDTNANGDIVKDFQSTGRTGRRNALADVLGEHKSVSTSDLPLKLEKLSTNGSYLCEYIRGFSMAFFFIFSITFQIPRNPHRNRAVLVKIKIPPRRQRLKIVKRFLKPYCVDLGTTHRKSDPLLGSNENVSKKKE